MTDEILERLTVLLGNADRETCQAIIKACRERLSQIGDDEILDIIGVP